jgi:BirA family biotin operon repressor/biotin-[acetyl-CoA-carboxylase] ligase
MKLKKFNFKNVNSTNDIAIRIIRNLKYKSGIIIAETQKKGRGQYGKKWTSYKGNLFVTIFFRIDHIKLTLEQLTKVNSLLVKKLLSFYYKKKITIKKPNDLLINKKKISGILQEKLTKSNQTFIIIGIGINLVKSPYIKNYPTTNFYELTNIKIDKNKIISNLKKIYENFISKLNSSNIIGIKKI